LETISHVLIFYLGARFGKLKIKWVGMITAMMADIYLVTSWAFLRLWGFSIPSRIWWLAAFLHSIPIILVFIPLLYFGKIYFFSASLGVYSHILLDIFTHKGEIPVFFPFSDYRPDVYIIFTLDPILIAITHMILLPILLYFEKASILEFIKSARKQVKFFDIFFMLGLIQIFFITTFVFSRLVGTSSLVFLVFLTIIFTLNAMIAVIIFCRESISDGKLKGHIIKIMKKMRLVE
jgi:membrane-bound metal-dependent hydrolase YbcI (DUF457 family)